LHDRPLTAEETDDLLDGVLDLYHEISRPDSPQKTQFMEIDAEVQRLSLPETLKDEALTESSTQTTPAFADVTTFERGTDAKTSATAPAQRDRYGFRSETQHVSLEEYNAWQARYAQHLQRRRIKWDAMLKESSPSSSEADQAATIHFPARSAKLQRYIRKGIPPEYRGQTWFHFANGHTHLRAHPGLYKRLVKQACLRRGDNNNDLIERDLHRTFPDNVHFKPDDYVRTAHSSADGTEQQEPAMIHSLRRVLQAFALYRPQVGYCQSLNFIAALFLLFMSEERAFWMLVITTTEYLPHVHDANLEGANVDQAVLMLAVRESLPAVWNKIGTGLEQATASRTSDPPIHGATREGLFRRPSSGKASLPSGHKATPHEIIGKLPPITLVTAAWFMSAFIGILPIETTLRVWDCLFYEGSKVLFRIALTILKLGERSILAVSDPMEIFQVVQTLPRQMIDAGALLEACFKRRNSVGHLSQKEVDVRRQKVAAIRNRQAAALLVQSSEAHDTSVVRNLTGSNAATKASTVSASRRSRDDLALMAVLPPTRQLSDNVGSRISRSLREE
jgi:hypothetical protein